MKHFKLIRIILLVALVVMSVSGAEAKTISTKQNQIKKFGSLNEFKKFVREKVEFNSGSIMPYAMTEMSARPVAAPSMDKAEAASDYSNTNVQVVGVDESDVVKTDGQFIYSINGQQVTISDVRQPQAPKVVTKISFKTQPQSLYLNDNKLVVVGYDYEFAEANAKLMIMPRAGFTFVKVFDVSDKSKPREVRSLRLEGDYSNSRVIKGYLYLITNNYNYSIGPVPLPRIYEADKLINSEKNTARYSVPNIYYFDMPYRNLNLTTVAAVNLNNDQQAIKTELYALPGGETVYASEQALYIAYVKYFDQAALMMSVSKEVVGPKLSTEDRNRLVRIEAVEDFILSSEEKLSKANQIIYRHLASLSMTEREALNKKIAELAKQRVLANLNNLQVTVVHKINLDGQNLRYQGFAEVPGRVLNQFALDESNGYLRLATTRDAVSNFMYLPGLEDKKSNGVYILDPKMKAVGKLEGLAPTEQIYAARFIDERLYLVTFEQVDPLLVIDLSKVNAPKLLGELKVPGFSQYLQAYSKNILLGVGRETRSVDGRVMSGGLKISLFDVSQVDKPKELDAMVLGGAGSDSSALYDHKALLLAPEKNLLAMPVSLTKQVAGAGWGELDFDGLVVLAVDGKTLKLRGKISHGQSANDYQSKIKRALYIKDNLFSISDKWLQVNQLDNLKELNKLQLSTEFDYQISN